MAIGTDDAVDKYGTQDTVTSSSSSVADGVLSVAGDITTWTNDDDATIAAIIFEGTFATAPDANSSVHLYARLMNIQSTNDAEAPDVTNFEPKYLGSFPLNDVTSAQYAPIDIRLPNQKTSQEYDFYIKNGGGQTLSAGWDLYITPKTYGPHT